MEWTIRVHKKLSDEIRAFAKKAGITNEEAARRAYLMIDGVVVEPLESGEISVEITYPHWEPMK